MEFNEKISAVEPSRSVTLLAKTKEMMRSDKDIINLTGGEPDFPTPKPICDEVARQLKAGNTHYSDSRGNEDLRVRIAQKLNEENNAPYTKDQILVTPGGKMAIYLIVRALLNPGDEVIWLAPGWVSYPSIVEVAGGEPVAVHLRYDEDYRITRGALEAAVSDRTKLIIVNYPNNPTGRILTDSDIRELGAVLRAHPGIRLLSDEIYEKIVYDGKQVVSMASFPEFFDRVIVVNGFSKCSAMTGWRVGYLACSDQKLYDVMLKLFQHCMSCTSVFLQKGALVALDCREETEKMRLAYEQRRNLLVDGMRDIPGVELVPPDGSFYAWTRFDTDLSSEKLCEQLLSAAKISAIPSEAYGEKNAVCVRFSFAAPIGDLNEMLIRLKKFSGDVLQI